MAKDKYKIQINNKEDLKLTSSAVMSFPQPPERKAEEYLNAYEGYVYTASSAIAQEVASVELKLFKIKYTRTEPVTTQVFIHPVLSLLQHVNEFMTFYELTEATQVYLELVGEAFWVILRDGRNGLGEPKEIWPIRPDWVKVVPDSKNIVKEYIYNPGGNPVDKVHIPKENIIHFKYFNPKNPYRGRGSVQAAAMPLDIHHFAQDWNRNFFFNSALPGLVFTSEKKFNKRAVRQFIEQWQTSYAGRQNSHKVAFLGGGFKMEKASTGARDLDFTEQQKIMRDDILAVFRVPKTILGLTEDVNRANAEATTRAFMERVVTPRMIKYVGTLQEKLLPMFGLSNDWMLDFTDPSPEDVETKLKTYENGRKYNWLTSNEIRVWENLEPVEGGDTLGTVTSNEPMPDEEPSNSNEDEDTDNNENEEEDKGLLKVFTKLFPKKKTVRKVYKYRYTKPVKHMMPIPTKRMEILEKEALQASLTKDLKKLISELMKSVKPDTSIKPRRYKGQHEEIWSEDAKTAYWLDFVEKATQREMLLRRRVIPLFEEQEREVLGKLDNIKHYQKAKRKGLEDEVLFNVEQWSEKWLTVILPIIREIVIEEGNKKLNMLDINQDFNMDSDNVVRFLRERLAEFVTSINETTREQLKETLIEGLAEGESINELRKRVNQVMTYATTERAVLIARTEALRASNFAALEAYIQSDVVVAKEWLSERDSRVCPFCQQLDGKKIPVNKNFFDLGDNFTVTDENGKSRTLKFKLDAVEAGNLHPDCRCTIIPVVEETSKNYEKDITEANSSEIVKHAQNKASKMVEKAVKEASDIVEKAKTEAKALKEAQKQKIEVEKTQTVTEAVTEAQQIVKKAKKDAKIIMEEAEAEAEQKKSGILSEIKALRDKARSLISGKK